MKAVMSIGNPIKSDDNIGNVVIDKLQNNDIIKIKAEINPENFMNKLKEFDEIIILDALDFGGDVGEVKVFELDKINEVSISTHSIPINLIKRVLPNSKIKIVGIQPKSINFGEELTKEMKDRIEYIVEKITLFLKQ